MADTRANNRALWDAWSDDFQALWNAETGDGDLPPAPFPVDLDDVDDRRADLLPDLGGSEFVELGCGGGQASVGAAREGVARAVGVDFSPEQLAHARRLRDYYGVDVDFLLGDVTGVPLADDAFDVAFSGWVFHMVPDLDACLAEAHRVLRPGGLLVYDVPHPVYNMFDPDTNDLVRSYHAEGPRRTDIDGVEEDLLVFDRKVSERHDALVDAGFSVERVLEPGSPDPDDYDDDPLESNQPDLLAMAPRTLRFWAVAE